MAIVERTIISEPLLNDKKASVQHKCAVTWICHNSESNVTNILKLVGQQEC